MHERRHALPIRRAHGRDEPLGHLLRSLSGLRLGGLSLGSAGGQRYQQQDSNARTHTYAGPSSRFVIASAAASAISSITPTALRRVWSNSNKTG